MHKYFFEKIQAKSLDASFPFSKGTLLSSATRMQIHTYLHPKTKQNLQIYTSIATKRILYFVLFNFHLHPKDSSLIKKNKDATTSKNDSTKNVSAHQMFSNYKEIKKVKLY